jgi:putative endonuclease
MFLTYILYSPRLDRYYIGPTDNIRARLQHQMAGNTAYTLQAADWQLVFLQEQATRAMAMRMEREIKRKKSRPTIQRYVCDRRNQVSGPVPISDW